MCIEDAECLQFLQWIPYIHHIDLFTCRHVLGAMVTSEMAGTPTSVSTGNLQMGLSNLLLSMGTLPQSSAIVPRVSSSLSPSKYTYLVCFVNPRKKSDFTLRETGMIWMKSFHQ